MLDIAVDIEANRVHHASRPDTALPGGGWGANRGRWHGGLGPAGSVRRISTAAMCGAAILGVLLLAGCAGGNDPAYFDRASSVAPAKYDTQAEQVTAGTAVCIQHAEQQKSNEQIVESVVFWSKGGVTAAEAQRFVPYALQYCDYLLSPEAKQLASS